MSLLIIVSRKDTMHVRTFVVFKTSFFGGLNSIEVVFTTACFPFPWPEVLEYVHSRESKAAVHGHPPILIRDNKCIGSISAHSVKTDTACWVYWVCAGIWACSPLHGSQNSLPTASRMHASGTSRAQFLDFRCFTHANALQCYQRRKTA